MATDIGLFTSRLRELVAGAITVLDVDLEERDEPDPSYLLVQFRLSEPRGESWDLDDFSSVRSQARGVATTMVSDQGFELGYVSGEASTDEQVGVDAGPDGKRAQPQRA